MAISQYIHSIVIRQEKNPTPCKKARENQPTNRATTSRSSLVAAHFYTTSLSTSLRNVQYAFRLKRFSGYIHWVCFRDKVRTSSG